MSVRIVCANPGLTLFRDDESDERVAVASLWRVDWSEHGRGHAVVLWLEGRTRIVTEQPALGEWLADSFVRHFPEVAGLPWPDPVLEPARVEWELDLARGLRATAADVEIEIAEPMDRRRISVPDFAVGTRSYALTNVFVPCRVGTITIDGERVDGVPHVDDGRPSSSAFLADAEVWSD